MITFHHFTQPQWFDALGGFEKKANIPIFRDFCLRVFQEYGIFSPSCLNQSYS
jgi:beta-glucosidase/6-phospho-beta-glucosidase/beta-galactosidase